MIFHLIVVMIVTLGSCTPSTVIRQGWRRDKSIEELLAAGAADFAMVKDLAAEAQLTLVGSTGRERATAMILFAHSGRLRVDVRGPLYSHLFTAVVEKDSVTVVPAEGRGWKGTSSRDLLLGLTGIDLGGYDLPSVLLGSVEPGRLVGEVRYVGADRAIVEVQGTGALRRAWIDVHRGFVTREDVMRPDGSLWWTRELSSYRRVGPAYLPQHVEIRQEDSVLQLEYRRCRADEGIAETAFTRGIASFEAVRMD